MKKLKTVYLILGIASAVACPSGLLGAVLFGMKLSYIPMGVSSALSILGAYGIPFSFRSFALLRRQMRAEAEKSETQAVS